VTGNGSSPILDYATSRMAPAGTRIRCVTGEVKVLTERQAKARQKGLRLLGIDVDGKTLAAASARTRQRKAEDRQQEREALRSVKHLEQHLRKEGNEDTAILGRLMLDQMRRRAVTAVEIADQRAKQAGHEHGLADLLANDLMRKPTETLAAWSKFMPLAAEAASSAGELHLNAVRLLAQASNPAKQVPAQVIEHSASDASGNTLPPVDAASAALIAEPIGEGLHRVGPSVGGPARGAADPDQAQEVGVRPGFRIEKG
jgi:hypothetical protein